MLLFLLGLARIAATSACITVVDVTTGEKGIDYTRRNSLAHELSPIQYAINASFNCVL